MNITILAKSSSHPDSSYRVKFVINDGILSIQCSCPAGTYGQICKHVTACIDCDYKILYNISQQELLDDIVSNIKTSTSFNEFSKLLKRRKEIEKLQLKLKKEVKDINTNLAMKLKSGIKL